VTTFLYTTEDAKAQETALRIGLARVISAITSQATAETIASLTMANFIDEAIFGLDSTQIDVTAQIESEASASAQAELERAAGRKGRKQRLEELQELMMGREEAGGEPAVPGLIQAARDFDPNDVEKDDGVYATVSSEDMPL